MDILQEIGLTQGEEKVYLALLKAGEQKTGEISKYSSVHTSKIYPILDKLMDKGLVNMKIKNGVQYYKAQNPEKLVDYIQSKKEQLDRQEEIVKAKMPEIIRGSKKQEPDVIGIYKGFRAIKGLFEGLEGELVVFSPGDELNYVKYNKLFTQVWEGSEILGFMGNKERFPKGVRFSNVSFGCQITVSGNKVIMLNWEDDIVYLIDSSFMASRYIEIFYAMYDIAEE